MFVMQFMPNNGVTETRLYESYNRLDRYIAVDRYLRCQNAMQKWRRVIGTLLILTPLVLLLALILLAILLGSMGMDIHWTSKGRFYVTTACTFLTLCACIIAGVHLRRSAKRLG
jgi:hypothetical protein